MADSAPLPPARGSGPPRPARSSGEAPPSVRSSVAPPPGTVEREPPRREMDVRGETWIVEVAGEGLAGYAGDAAARVLLLTFRTEDAELPEREHLLPGASLEALSEVQLREAFDAAVLFRGEETVPGLFEETRRRREPRRG